ncbi:hypothetical protein SAMN04490202_1602 [Pseudomonas reinekei]|uniref:PD-(D/E)XK endonuclease-like domain-containing protein n=1 Tax=Pseudomonas reinekei TaxID=395598 RepID=A0A1H0LQQ4_PSERE|nr:hypothetical protein [Pseudomonas reinekei]KAB0484022.1 hypothetical protein F7R15_18525 [Pseudomonas reinekei]OLU02964.1 hypothetical protein BVK86_11665 [Pseudomonas reinekei]SDO70562.1 hypothetical protein SAMN04490202_1602 [Pseudomonas reinekei]
MISEQHFASSFTSLWHEIIPLADTYWRRENLKVVRQVLPIDNVAPVNLRGFLNELAFETFSRARCAGLQPKREVILSIAQQSIESVAGYILRITKNEGSAALFLDDLCKEEIFGLTRNLMLSFPDNKNFDIRPKFSGCGVVSACEGDLIYKDCLYEIKAGDRGFRVSDVKQLLIYSSLAFSKGELSFSKVGLFNPRNGYYWERTLDRLCVELSGMRASDVLSNIAGSMTQLAISR